MFGTIRKHQTWLWIILVAIMIVGARQLPVSVVGFSGSRRTGNANFGSIDGERVTQDDYSDAQREVYLRYFLSYGTWPDRTQKGRSSTSNAKRTSGCSSSGS